MSFLTTNPNNKIVNLPEIQNVVNNASGVNLSILNTTTASLQINTITSSQNNAFITIGTNTNFDNATIYMNGQQTYTANTINGTDSLSFQINGTNLAYLDTVGFGINNTNPTESLDVVGDVIFQGNLNVVSTIGAGGNGFFEGNIQAGSLTYYSDPVLKTNVQPYTVTKMPEPVSFNWKSSGKRDIGILATDLLEIEPSCIHIQDGLKTVDYPKLTILCLAELKNLRREIECLHSTIGTKVANSVLT